MPVSVGSRSTGHKRQLETRNQIGVTLPAVRRDRLAHRRHPNGTEVRTNAWSQYYRMMRCLQLAQHRSRERPLFGKFRLVIFLNTPRCIFVPAGYLWGGLGAK